MKFVPALLSGLALALAACAPHPGPAPESASAEPPSGSPAAPVSDASLWIAAATEKPAAGSAAPAPGAANPSDPLVGQPAPDFAATAQDGTAVRLSALRGRAIVVYFYPKDETPGCTREACSFRDSWRSISSAGAVLVGISADPAESHKSFAEHYKLPFLLVSDPDGSIARAYGVPFSGRHRRQTIVIGPDGTVRKVYRKVDVSVHAQQILEDLAHLS